jgi:hypothetical protein
MVMTSRNFAIAACGGVAMAGLWFGWSVPAQTTLLPRTASVKSAPDLNIAHSQATPDLRRLLQRMVTH